MPQFLSYSKQITLFFDFFPIEEHHDDDVILDFCGGDASRLVWEEETSCCALSHKYRAMSLLVQAPRHRPPT